MNHPTNRADQRRYRKRRNRRVWAFSDLNHDLRPEQVAKILVSAGLEQARREAEARADEEARRSRGLERDSMERAATESKVVSDA